MVMSYDNFTALPTLSNCSDLASNFQTPKHIFATLVPSIYEFDDTDESAQYSPSTQLSVFNLTALPVLETNNQISASFTSADGMFALEVTMHPDSGRDALNPFLAFDPRSCSVSLTINNYNYSR
jgi:hypothetical protein